MHIINIINIKYYIMYIYNDLKKYLIITIY